MPTMIFRIRTILMATATILVAVFFYSPNCLASWEEIAARFDDPSPFRPPQDYQDLQPAPDAKIHIGFVDFFSDRLDDETRRACLHIIAREFRFRPEFSSHYAVEPQEAIQKILRKEKVRDYAGPLATEVLRQHHPLDYYLFLEERYENKQWHWLIRAYNGRSGTFVFKWQEPFDGQDYGTWRDKVSFGLNELLLAASGRQTKPIKSNENQNYPIPQRYLPFVQRFDSLKNTRQDSLQILERLEQILRVSPGFVQYLRLNPKPLEQAAAFATSDLDKIRLLMLDGKIDEAGRVLEERFKPSQTKRGKEIPYRFRDHEAPLLARLAAIRQAQGDIEKASVYYDKALKLNPTEPLAILGKSRLLRKKNAWKNMISLLRKLPESAAWEYRFERISWEEIAYQGLFQKDKVLESRLKLAEKYLELGDTNHPNKIWLEVLEEKFDINLAFRLNIKHLSQTQQETFLGILKALNLSEPEVGVDGGRLLWRTLLHTHHAKQAEDLQTRLLNAFPDDPSLMLDLAKYYDEEREDPKQALGYLEKIPLESREPWLSYHIYKDLKMVDQAEAALSTHLDEPPYRIAMRHCAALFALESRRIQAAFDHAQKALDIYPGREDFYAILQQAGGKDEDMEDWKATELFLMGKEFDNSDLSHYVLGNEYKNMLSHVPVVGKNDQGKQVFVRRVMVLNTDKVPLRWEVALKHMVLPYQERGHDLLGTELRKVLASRFEVTYDKDVEKDVRRNLMQDKTTNLHELGALAVSMQVDGIYLIKTYRNEDQKKNRIKLDYQLYYYDHLADRIYRSRSIRSIPYYSLYQFNRYYLALPVLALLLLLMLFRLFQRLTYHWTNPMEYAKHLMKKRKYEKAIKLLNKMGCGEDVTYVMAQQAIHKGDYLSAMSHFFRIRDMENGETAANLVPPTEDNLNLMAELYTEIRDFDKAMELYRKTKNLTGLAKVYRAQGKTERALRVMAQYYIEKGDIDAAVDQFKRLGDFNRAAKLMMKHERYEEAAKLFRQVGDREMFDECMTLARKKQSGTT